MDPHDKFFQVFTTVDICTSTLPMSMGKKERLPLIDCFDFSPKSAGKLKKKCYRAKQIY